VRRIAALAALLAAGCVEPNPDYCKNDLACPNGTLCDPFTHTCRAGLDLAGVDGAPDAGGGCMSSSECANPTPICGPGQMCTGCNGDGDCASATKQPHCLMGACVECASNDDCAAKNMSCNLATGACGPCSDHADCSSGVCIASSCVAASRVVYVDNSKPCAGMGTQAAPYCDLPNGVMMAMTSNALAVKIAGNANQAYIPVDLTGAKLSLIGPGLDATPTAKIGCGAVPCVKAGDGTTATVDGLDLGFGTADVVDCSSSNLSGSLTVLRSSLHDAGRTGLVASNCTVVLDADSFTNDALGGISVTNCKSQITNCTVTASGKDGAGVTLASPSNGSYFRHNTVAFNNPTSGVGGVACVPAGMIENSIVWGNAKGLSNSQILGCAVTNSLLDEFITGNGNKNGPAPTFTPDLHLDGHKGMNNACCIDQLQSSTVMHDRDFKPRPFPAMGMFDIGAHEVQN
jgi:hypothetical protein